MASSVRNIAVWVGALSTSCQRVLPLMREGGYIPHTDHSLPPDISFANYTYYMNKFSEVSRNI